MDNWDKYVNVYRYDPPAGTDHYYTSGYVVAETQHTFSLALPKHQGVTVFSTNHFYYEVDPGD